MNKKLNDNQSIINIATEISWKVIHFFFLIITTNYRILKNGSIYLSRFIFRLKDTLFETEKEEEEEEEEEWKKQVLCNEIAAIY